MAGLLLGRLTPLRTAARVMSLSRLFRPECVYPALLLAWGTVLALLLPPLQCPDEGSHAIRCFHLSRGRLHPDGTIDGWLSGRAPESLYELWTVMRGAQRRLTPQEQEHFRSVRLQTDPERVMSFGMHSCTCFVPYVPQALGIAVVHKMGGSMLTAFYAGRLANLLMCVLALHLALRLLPFYKNLLGAVALLPISVQQMANLSADALGIASCFVFTALAFKILVPAERRPGALTLLALCGTALLLPLCKLPYALLTLIYLGAGPSRLGSWRKYICWGAILAATTGLGIAITLEASDGATHLGEGIPSPEVSRSRQLDYVKHHPEAFLEALGRSCAHWGWLYCEQLAIVGSLNVVVGFLPAKAYLLFVVLMALLDRRPGWRPGPRLQLLALAVSLLGFMFFHLLLYLVWTQVASPVIEGFQGRYFVGFLPVLLLLFYSPAVQARGSTHTLLALTAAASTAVQVATVHAVLAAFYFKPQPSGAEPGTAAVLLVGALLFLATLFALEWRAQDAQPHSRDPGGPAEEPGPQQEVRPLSRAG